MKIINSVLKCVISLTFIFGLTGCEDNEPISTISVITGSISSTSKSSSISKSISKSISSEQQSIVVELKDVNGFVIHQSTVVRNSSNKFPFAFEGEFSNKELWLNVKTGADQFNIALGVSRSGDNALDLGAFDLVDYSLSTEYLKKTKRFSTIRRQSSGDMKEILSQISKNIVHNLKDKEEFLAKKDLLNLDENGDFYISNVVFPNRYDHPDRKERQWEISLFKGIESQGIAISDIASDDYILSDRDGTSFNIIKKAYMVVGNDKFLVFDSSSEQVGKPKQISLGSGLTPFLRLEFDRELTPSFVRRMIKDVFVKTTIPSDDNKTKNSSSQSFAQLTVAIDTASSLLVKVPVIRSNVMHYTIQNSLRSAGMEYGYLRALFSVQYF
ncbi:MAG: hypothetical protein COB02_09570 [Candidatus Cloacimonadota bacterium]|nr:MAG: hypothetical protein COB02_09570 [Candidatus Cloacimonadota bacterium]